MTAFIRKIILCSALSLSLAACSTMNMPGPSNAAVTDAAAKKPVTEEAVKPVAVSADPAKPVMQTDIRDLTLQNTKGSVEVFPLEGGANSQAGATMKPENGSQGVSAAQPSKAGAGASSRDPSVQIFPLDDAMGGLVPPANRAPSVNYPPLALNARQPDFVSIQNSDGAATVIYFNHGSVRLGTNDLKKLSGISSAFNSNSGALIVEGHASIASNIADPVQRKLANLKISMERAFKVAKALMENGVPAEQIETRAYGETRPAATEDKSRRVEIRGSGQ